MSARSALGILAFFMFTVTQMIKSSLYIAVEGLLENNSTSDTDNIQLMNKTENKELIWSSQERGLLFGAFYASYWITELPGGLLAHRFGGKTVLGYAVFLSGLTALMLPFACTISPYLASVVRALQGLAMGATWPAMHCLAGRWIPKSDRGKFMSTYHGAALGSTLTYPLGGILVAKLGWPYALIIPGLLCLVWCIFWYRYVYNSPQTHPCISEREKMYLERNLEDVNSLEVKQKLMPPWRSVLRCKPFWAVFVASFSLMWGTITLSMQLPAYMKDVYLLDIQTNGFLLGLPELGKLIFSIIYSIFMDKAMKKKVLSITSVRKISVTICTFIPGLCLLGICWYGYKSLGLVLSLIILSVTSGGASSSGSLANIVDLSPKYAGSLLGAIKTFCVLPGVLSPILVSYTVSINRQYKDPQEWNIVFYITATIYLISFLVFMIYGSGEEQDWSIDRTIHITPMSENNGEAYSLVSEKTTN